VTERPDRSAGRGVILLYHRIAVAEFDPFSLCLPPDEFRFQIGYVKQHCRPMSLEALVHAVRSGSVPDRAVAVTLDDAYIDNLTVASPLLTAAELPATFFATTADLDRDREFWWDTVTRLLLGEPSLPAVLEFHWADGSQRTVPTSADRHALLRSVHDMMRLLPARERDGLVQQLVRQVDRGRTQCAARPMTGPDLQVLASRPGHDLGAHTRHHLSLPAQPDDVCLDECRDSRTELEALLNRSVISLAYPFGDLTERTVKHAADAGFSIGVTIAAEPVTSFSDVMRLPRLPVPASRALFSEAVEQCLRRGVKDGSANVARSQA
jgi:peptidoglycan/xylan/chitin deacetylase (PgdA/CDA1 family)